MFKLSAVKKSPETLTMYTISPFALIYKCFQKSSLSTRNISSKWIKFWPNAYPIFTKAFLEVWLIFLFQNFFHIFLPFLFYLFTGRLRFRTFFMVWAKMDKYALLVILRAQQTYIVTFSPKEPTGNGLQEGFPAKTSQFPLQTLLINSFIMCGTKDPSRIKTSWL